MAKGKKKNILIIFLLFINFLAVMALCLAYLSAYINPEKFWIPSFFGLAYLYILIINLIFIVLWLFIRIKYTLISLITVLAGYQFIFSSFQISSRPRPLNDDEAFKILSYNVRNFDLYNYKKNWEPNFTKRNKIFQFLNTEKPDIICFQEYVNDLSGKFKTGDTMATFLEARNIHAEYTVVSRNINQFGIATFSRYPIVNKGLISFPNSKTNICIYTDLLINADTVRVYNTHFESLHFGYAEIDFAEKLTSANTENESNIKQKSGKLLNLLRKAFINRAAQVNIVSDHISKCPYPVIVCSDLNDTPVSYAYKTLSEGLDDAFVESGKGFGHTFTGFKPSFRIDYILYSEVFQSFDFRNIPSGNSDHYPVSCYLKLQKNVSK